jgi:hypothetical protein
MIRQQPMTLSFPNPSRSFDANKNCVNFWGYDNVIEIAFFIETAALQKLYPETNDTEAGSLKAFDAVRKRIYEVAEDVYLRGRRKGSFAYNLTAEDF